MSSVPVLDVGGSHVSAAWVDTGSWTVDAASVASRPLSPDGSADALIAAIAATTATLGDLDGCTLTAAVPGPFDYDSGVAHYAGVGKFEALAGVDLGAALLGALPSRPDELLFVNDATAFALGEWAAGAASGAHRVIGITLGTGVGSGFLADGRSVDSGPTVPPDAELHLTTIDGRPLEDLVSTRAIVRAYGRHVDGVLAVVTAARAGDTHAQAVLDTAFATLGHALAPWVIAFAADTVVVGGKIAGAWDELAGPVARGLHEHGAEASLLPARNPSTAAEIGAAWYGHSRRSRDYHDTGTDRPEVTMTEQPDPSHDDNSANDSADNGADDAPIKGAAKKVRDVAIDARTAAADKLRDGFDKVIDSLDSLSSKKEQ